MDGRRRKWLIVALIGGLGVVGALSRAWSIVNRPLADHQIKQAIAALKAQAMAPGFHPRTPLPAPFRGMTRSGTVDLVKTADGRLIVLFKTSLGWKGNYSGTIPPMPP